MAERLSDQVCAEDALSSQKFLMGNYNTAIYEAANPNLRADFLEIHRQEQEAAQKVFNFLNQRGWYRPSPADPKMISEARAKLQQMGQGTSRFL